MTGKERLKKRESEEIFFVRRREYFLEEMRETKYEGI